MQRIKYLHGKVIIKDHIIAGSVGMSARRGFSVIMPVYNEERTSHRIIRRVLARKEVDRLIIVYDTRSSDGTLPEIARAIKGDGRVLLLKRRLHGKGSNIRLGIGRVRSGPIIIQDADEEYYPEDYPKLLRELRNGQPVFGYRRLAYGRDYGYRLGNVVNRVTSSAFDLLFGQRVRDVNVCYKAFTKEMLGGRRLDEDGFTIEIEIAAALAKNGYRIANVPIRYNGRSWEEGKKIAWRDGVALFLAVFKERLLP